MASNYPGGYDNLTARTDSSTATPNAHANDHTDERNAINAIQAELGLDPAGASATVKARLDALDTTVAGKEATGVAAALVDDLSGVTNPSAARTQLGLGDSATKNVGIVAGTVAAGDDSRLSNSRTPTAHKSTHATGGTDALAPSDIGAVPTTRTVAGKALSADVTLSNSDISGLGTAATKNAPASGNAASGETVLGSDTRLADSRQPTSHASTHASAGSDPLTLGVSQVTGAEATANKGAANGYASLDAGGKITSSQLPAIAITDTFTAASQTAMLALSGAEKGDICVRTDQNRTYVLAADPYSTLANWQELLTPTDAVLSVNGLTGAVTLGTMSSQASNNVTITGGSVTGITDLAIADGGTGASTAAGALSNLGAEATANKGVAGGYASLDSGGKLPSAQLPSSGLVTSVDGTSGAVSLTSSYQPLSSDLTAVAGIASAGIVVKTGSGTAINRTIASSGTGLTVTNGGGVVGNPTLALNQNLQDIAGITRSAGDIITGGAAAYTNLAKGNSGQFLQAGASSLSWAYTPRCYIYNAGTTVSNTTTATSLLTATGSSASTHSNGDVYRITASGVATNNTGTGTYTLTFALLWGATTIASWTTPALSTSANSRIWNFDAHVVVKATGASGQLAATGMFGMTAPTTATFDSVSGVAHQGILASQTTLNPGGQAIDFKLTPSFASASLSATCYEFTVVSIPKI